MRKVIFTLSLLAMFALTSCASGDLKRSNGKIIANDKGLSIEENGKEVLRYFFTGKGFKPYVETLCTPGGINVLLDSPADHKHHHGLMYATKLDGITFWDEAGKVGTQKQDHADKLTGKNPSFTGKVEWVFKEWDVPYLHEQRTIKLNSGSHERVLTWESVFTADKSRESVEFSGDHFYGLGMRFIPSMNDGGSFSTPTKDERPAFGGDQKFRLGHWCAYTAKAEGKDVTVAMFDSPNNIRKVTWFTMTKPFAYISATIEIYKKPLVLEKGKELKLCYGAALWDGKVTDENIEAAYQKWIKSNNLSKSKDK